MVSSFFRTARVLELMASVDNLLRSPDSHLVLVPSRSSVLGIPWGPETLHVVLSHLVGVLISHGASNSRGDSKGGSWAIS